MAVNLGDYLVGLGYRVAGNSGKDLSDKGIASDIIARIASAHTRLAEGQGKELQWRSKRCILPSLEVLEIYALKTTPAFEAALFAGVRCAMQVNETLNEDLVLFSRHLGVGFQILDDLHEWSEETAIDHEIGGDLHKAPIILSSLAKEAFGKEKQERLEALIAGNKMDWKIQKRVHKYFKESDAYEKAIALARRCRKRSLDVANRIEPLELGDLLRFFVEKILPLPETDFQKDSATK
jgi:geranylgeranyl pyrophosphate synthase